MWFFFNQHNCTSSLCLYCHHETTIWLWIRHKRFEINSVTLYFHSTFFQVMLLVGPINSLVITDAVFQNVGFAILTMTVVMAPTSEIVPQVGTNLWWQKYFWNFFFRLVLCSFVQMTMWISDIWATRKEKKSGLNGIRTHGLCDTCAVLYQLGYQAIWKLVTLRVPNIPVNGEECKWIYEYRIFELRRKIWRRIIAVTYKKHFEEQVLGTFGIWLSV